MEKIIEAAGSEYRVSNDGYDEELVELMRELRLNWTWHPGDKVYAIPENRFDDDVLEALERLGYEII